MPWHRPNPFARPLDRVLERLRRISRDAYRLVPGQGSAPDRWRARCPLHPDAGFTLWVVDYGDKHWPLIQCDIGCQPTVLWRLLRPELQAELNSRAEHRAEVLLWAKRWSA